MGRMGKGLRLRGKRGVNGNDRAANRVLIVDDDAAICRTLTLIAEASGYDAMAIDDTAAMREQLKRFQPSLVILDLQMPGRDGVQFLADLGETKCQAPVVLASGADRRILDAALRLGRERGLNMAGTLPKPFRLEAARALLERFKALPRPSAEELAEAIKTDQLFLEYQPKLDCHDRTVSGVEALVRWQHPSRGRLPPDQFIPTAEQDGLIDPLTDWVFRAAVRQATAWAGAGLLLDVAVNLSARNLDRADLPDRLAQRCNAFGVEPETVILEVTESAAMCEPLVTLEVLTRLRIKGFRLSMDDFGTAYSSLVQLQRMPFSELKIDRSFVSGMSEDRNCTVICRIICNLARELGLRSIAEGVESEDAWDALKAMGCDAAQGYHISRPISADRIAQSIERGDWRARAAKSRA
jgi:EAL domain-containing protein (putative c-di-GMP-specific phosphodiesterase class I)